ncbi:ferredoxin family protein [Kitasatospora atroaurantiaca]|uniref:Ferredoxin n=1 Tax=Kitasatospora atroaurantiaca TaxID=285545 RepID=A0A561EJM2_9ACTN|nr:ferredoxin FdxA [Kitasatospora atroaurantiaca]TWE15772.1 ferredoxin [Kitasatospora atroaurantiaca]
MTYVVTDACIRCKYTDCAAVCPTDAFRQGPNMLVIDPDECTDDGTCVAECPVEAIFAEEDLPADKYEFIRLNSELASQWPAITQPQDALPDADKWNGVSGKRRYLKR